MTHEQRVVRRRTVEIEAEHPDDAKELYWDGPHSDWDLVKVHDSEISVREIK